MENTDNNDITGEVYLHELYGVKTEVMLDFTQYCNNGTLALQMLCRPDCSDLLSVDGPDEIDCESESEFCSPYATLTVNLPSSEGLAVNEQFVDENNLPGIGQWLENAGIATPTGQFCQSGFCTYQAYAFNVPEAVKEATRAAREDASIRNLISDIEQSGLKPSEVHEKGELYSISGSGADPEPAFIVYKGTCPKQYGTKCDVFILGERDSKGVPMFRLSDLPEAERRHVAGAVRNAVSFEANHRLKR